MGMRKTKPPLGFLGSTLLCGWGLYRFFTASYDSYLWTLPLLFAVLGGIGMVLNTVHFLRNKPGK